MSKIIITIMAVITITLMGVAGVCGQLRGSSPDLGAARLTCTRRSPGPLQIRGASARVSRRPDFN